MEDRGQQRGGCACVKGVCGGWVGGKFLSQGQTGGGQHTGPRVVDTGWGTARQVAWSRSPTDTTHTTGRMHGFWPTTCPLSCVSNPFPHHQPHPPVPQQCLFFHPQTLLPPSSSFHSQLDTTVPTCAPCTAMSLRKRVANCTLRSSTSAPFFNQMPHRPLSGPRGPLPSCTSCTVQK